MTTLAGMCAAALFAVLTWLALGRRALARIRGHHDDDPLES